MAITLQELLVKVSADISEYSSGIDEAISKASSMGSVFDGIGGALSAGLTVPLAAIGTAAMEAAANFKAATNAIIVGTGAMGSQLESLKGSFSEVFVGVTASSKTVGESIAYINTALGLTGEPLEKLTTQLLSLAKITGAEVGPLVQSTVQAFKQWGVATEEQAGKLDYLFSVSQHTNATIGTLTSGLTEFGSSLKNMGLGLEQSAALLGELNKQGVPAAQAMNGLRKAVSEMAKAGMDTSHGFQDVVTWIKSAKTEAEGLQRSIEVFGAKGGGTLFQALKSGALDVQNLATSMGNANRTILETEKVTSTLSGEMVKAWHKVEEAITPIGQIINSTMRQAFEGIAPIVTGAVSGISKAFTSLPDVMQRTIVGFGAIAAAAGPAWLAISKGAPLAMSAFSSLAGMLAPLPAIFARLGTAALDAFVMWPSKIPGTATLLGGLANALKSLPGLFVNLGTTAVTALANIPATITAISTAMRALAVSAFAGLSASIANISFAVSNNLVGALSTGEKALLGLGYAAGIAAAAFVGWELGSWLYNNVPLLQQFGDAIGDLIAKIPGIQSLIEKMAGLSKVQAQTPALVAGLEDRLKAKGVEVKRTPGMSDSDYQAYLNKLAADYKAPVAGETAAAKTGAGQAPAGSAAKNAALTNLFNKENIAKAAEEAKKFAEALETVGLAAMHTEKLQSAMVLVGKAFETGRVSVEQYGQAVANVIDKELKAAEHLKDTTIAGSLDKQSVLYFRDALTELDKEYSKGKIGVDGYVEGLRSLQAQMAAASGTSLQVGLKGLGIVSDKQLAEAYQSAKHYFDMVSASGQASANELSKAWQKTFDELSKSDPRLVALGSMHIIPIEQLAHDASEAIRHFHEIADNAKSTFGEAADATEKAWQEVYKTMASVDPRLHSLGSLDIISVEQLEHAAEKAKDAYAVILASARSTAGEIAAAFEKAWRAAFEFDQSKSPFLTGLKQLGVTSQKEMDHIADNARAAFVKVASSGQASAETLRDAWNAMVRTVQQNAPVSLGDRALEALGIPSEARLQKAVDDAKRLLEDLRNSGRDTAEATAAALDKIWEAENRLANSRSASATALGNLGIPTDAELNRSAATLRGWYDTIASDANRSLREVSAAWEKMYAAQVAASSGLQALKFFNLPSQAELDHSTKMVIDAYNAIRKMQEEGSASQFQAEQARLIELQRLVQIAQAQGHAVTLAQSKEIFELQQRLAKANIDIWGDVHKEVAGVVDTLDTGLAHALLNIKNFGAEMKKTLTSVFEGVFTDVFKALTKPLTDWLKTTLTDAISPIVSSIAKSLGLTVAGSLASTGVQGATAAASAAGDAALHGAVDAATGGVTAASGAAGAGAATTTAGGSLSQASTSLLSTASSIANIAGAVAAIGAGITAGIQAEHANNLLDNIEKNTRSTFNQLLSLQSGANDYWPSMKDTYSYLVNQQFSMLQEIRDAIRSSVAVNLSVRSGSQSGDAVINSIVGKLNTPETLVTDRLLDIKVAVLHTADTIRTAQGAIISSIDINGEKITGQLVSIAQRLPTEFENLVQTFGSVFGGGGGIGGVIGGLGSAIGGLANGLTGGLVGGIISGIGGLFSGSGKDEGRIELNTRSTFNEVVNLRADEWLRYSGVLAKFDDLHIMTAERLDAIFGRLGEVWNTLQNLGDISAPIVAALDGVQSLLQQINVAAGGNDQLAIAKAITDGFSADLDGFDAITAGVDNLANIASDGFTAIGATLGDILTAVGGVKTAVAAVPAVGTQPAPAAAATTPTPTPAPAETTPADTQAPASTQEGIPFAPVAPATTTPLPENQGIVNALMVVNQSINDGFSGVLKQLQSMGGIGGGAGTTVTVTQPAADQPQTTSSTDESPAAHATPIEFEDVVNGFIHTTASANDLSAAVTHAAGVVTTFTSAASVLHTVTDTMGTDLAALSQAVVSTANQIAIPAHGITEGGDYVPPPSPQAYPEQPNVFHGVGQDMKFDPWKGFDTNVARPLDPVVMNSDWTPAPTIVIQNNSFRDRSDMDYLVELARTKLG